MMREGVDSVIFGTFVYAAFIPGLPAGPIAQAYLVIE
jgi:hypothetical protein